MYFWDVKALANDLKENRVNQKEQLKYYLFIMLAIAVLMHLRTDSPWSTPVLNWTALGLNFFTTLLGILWCYKANSTGDNKDFIIRMVCLAFPIGMRISVVFFIIFLLIFLLLGTEFSEPSLIFNIVLINAVNYIWIRSYLLYISDVTTPSVNQE